MQPKIALLCLLVPMLGWAGQDGAAAGADARKLLIGLASKYAGADTYSFEANLQIIGQRGETPGRVLSKAKVRLAASPGGKWLLHIVPVDKDEYLLVSNGEKSWAYVPKLKQYTETEGGTVALEEDDEAGEGESSEERDLAEKFSRQLITVLGEMVKSPSAIGVKEPEAVKYGGRKYKWPVAQSLSKKSAEGQTLTEVTVDPETLRIGKLVWSYSSNQGSERTVIQLTAEFDGFTAREALPDSTFTFEPPKKAKLVESVPIPGQTGSFLLNSAAPDFEAKTFDGERVRLSGLRDRVVLLNFWASWCGPCRRELPTIVKLHEELKGQGLTVLGVNDEGKGEAQDYAKTTGLRFPTLDDSSRKLHRLYRVSSIPSVFIIGRDGKVVRFLKGAHDEKDLRAALKSAGL